jgi:hypothetical protein
MTTTANPTAASLPVTAALTAERIRLSEVLREASAARDSAEGVESEARAGVEGAPPLSQATAARISAQINYGGAKDALEATTARWLVACQAGDEARAVIAQAERLTAEAEARAQDALAANASAQAMIDRLDARAQDAEAQVLQMRAEAARAPAVDVLGAGLAAAVEAMIARHIAESESRAHKVPDAEDVAAAIDMDDLAEALAEAVAGKVSARDVARFLDMGDLASEISASDIASEISASDIASEIDLSDVAGALDTEALCELLDVDAKINGALARALRRGADAL